MALAIIGLAFYLRLIGLDRGIWLDEYLAIDYSARAGLLGTAKATMSNNQLPAFYIMLKVWSLIGGSEPFLRFFPVVCNVATVAVLIAWLKRYSFTAALMAGFLFFFIHLPILIFVQGQNIEGITQFFILSLSLGIIDGYVFWKTKGVLAPIVAHSSLNFLSLLIG